MHVQSTAAECMQLFRPAPCCHPSPAATLCPHAQVVPPAVHGWRLQQGSVEEIGKAGVRTVSWEPGHACKQTHSPVSRMQSYPLHPKFLARHATATVCQVVRPKRPGDDLRRVAVVVGIWAAQRMHHLVQPDGVHRLVVPAWHQARRLGCSAPLFMEQVWPSCSGSTRCRTPMLVCCAQYWCPRKPCQRTVPPAYRPCHRQTAPAGHCRRPFH